ncbi:MAG: HigA family addiction module antitoxin [Capsulimonadales bacterium]|nr:HigA family addiction module antitoxin [Capsulimonadales bacterium]
MARLENIHPGEVLEEEFLIPMGITAYKLAKSIDVQQTQISQIIHGKRAITAATALRLAAFFGTSAQFWLNLQAQYDLEEARQEMGEALAAIPRHSVLASA